MAKDYEPTPAEARLISVLLDPNYALKSITDICKAAQTSTNTYYKAIKKPGFNRLLQDMALNTLRGRIGHVISATYKYSQLPKNHQDRKLALELTGAYTQKAELTTKTDLDQETKAEIIAKVAERLKQKEG